MFHINLNKSLDGTAMAKETAYMKYTYKSQIATAIGIVFFQLFSLPAIAKPRIKVIGVKSSVKNSSQSSSNSNSGVVLFEEAYSGPKLSLPEALQTALDKNPKTQANEMRLKAEFERLTTTKQTAYLPRLNVSVGQSLNDPTSKSGLVGINWNLFNSFSDYYRIKAQECNYKKQEAQYNSTDAFIKNTSGQIAGLVASYFINLTMNRSELLILNNVMTLIDKSLSLDITPEQQIQLENMRNSYQVRIDSVQSNVTIAERNYQYIVTETAPDHIESLDETIQSIIIPVSSSEAYQIGLEKSPEILTVRLGLQCLRLSHKSTKAAQRGVRVDLTASRNTNFNDRQSNSVFITVSKSIGADTITGTQSEATQIEAAQLDMDGAVADLENNLFVNYKQLDGKLKSAASFEKNLNRISKQIQDLIENHSGNEREVDLLINLIGAYHGNWMNASSAKQEIINLKFSIQRNIGTLFESTERTQP